MKNLTILIFSILTLTLSSCSTVNLKVRKGKDIVISSTNYQKLKGTYENQLLDTIGLNFTKTLFDNFTIGTYKKRQSDFYTNFYTNFYTEIIPVDSFTLKLNFYKHEEILIKNELVKSITLKGELKNGYFKVKRQYPTKFIAGPLLWMLGEKQNYIGLTNDNNLVVLNSGGKGALFLIVVPFFVAKGDAHNYEYKRIE